MSLIVTTMVGTGTRKDPADTVDKVADRIADTIKSEAADLQKAGYAADPTSIRVTASDLRGFLDITMKANRS